MTAAVSPVWGTGALQPLAPATVHPAAPSGGGLLPAPAGTLDIGDAITVLLKVSSQLAEGQARLGEAHAQVADAQRREAGLRRKEALDRAVEAAQRAEEEARSSGALFSFVTDNIGVVGLIGLATFRWDLVATDIVAHQTELTKGSTGLLELGALAGGGPLGMLAAQAMDTFGPDGLRAKDVAAFMLGGPLGAALQRGAAKLVPEALQKDIGELATIEDDDVRVANKVALMVAMTAVAATSTVVTGGTTAPALVALLGIGISTATQLAAQTGLLEKAFGEKAAMYIALGGTITGAILTAGGAMASAGAGADAVARVVGGVNTAKSMADGAVEVTAGLAELRRADAQHEADLANVDAQEEKQLMQRIEKLVDGILDDLREAKRSSQRAAEILQSTLQIDSQTLLQAGSLKV